MSCRPLDVESFRNRARLPKGITRRKRGGYDESKKVSRTLLVVDGEWTGETLRVMANVFDYVVPISRVPDLVSTVKSYLAGDKSKLKWLIQFRVTAVKPMKSNG